MAGIASWLDYHHASLICHLLTPRDAARCSSASGTHALAKAAASSEAWQAYAARALGEEMVAECRGPLGEDCEGHWRTACKFWWYAARTAGVTDGAVMGGPVPARWIEPVCRLRSWLTEHAQHVHDTLRPGVSKDTWAKLAETGWNIAPEVRGLWELVDGQSAPMESTVAIPGLHMRALEDDDENWALGLFGGYTAYGHSVSTLFLSMDAAMQLTKMFQTQMAQGLGQTKLLFACSYNFNKFFFVDVADGSVHALNSGARRWRLDTAAASSFGTADGLLRWVSEYTRRLESGVYTVAPLRPERAPLYNGVSLFATKGPELSHCVTRGVIITGTPIYLPEAQHGWMYSITMELTSTAADRGFETCQLSTREWEIEDSRGNVERVAGEGVVGFMPILADGGWRLNRESDPHGCYAGPVRLVPGPFRYQSFSGRTVGMTGRFGGYLQFVPGTIKNPTGPPFRARLEPFVLEVPEFIF